MSNAPPIDTTGVTVWELREMARLIARGDLDEAIGATPYDPDPDDDDDMPGGVDIPEDLRRDAILVEALRCLADKKESER